MFTQATESPPPTSENAPLPVASPIASPTTREPVEKLSNSNTPVGPFQRIVFDSRITFVNIAIDSGPISIPIQPSGTLFTGQYLVLASLANLSAILSSTAKTKFTPFSFAFAMISNAKSNLSSSTIELPILPP